MKIKYVGKNIKVTEGIKTKVEDKLETLNKYFLINDDTVVSVLVRTYPVNDKIEITIPTKFATLRTEVIHEDLYAAIDLAIDKLEDQIRRQKTRLNRKNKKYLSHMFDIDKDVDINEDESTLNLIDNDSKNDELVRTKSIELDNMDLDEAIMKMEMLDHSFYIYRDNEENKVSIVYKRKNEGYGLIEVDND